MGAGVPKHDIIIVLMVRRAEGTHSVTEPGGVVRGITKRRNGPENRMENRMETLSHTFLKIFSEKKPHFETEVSLFLDVAI